MKALKKGLVLLLIFVSLRGLCNSYDRSPEDFPVGEEGTLLQSDILDSMQVELNTNEKRIAKILLSSAYGTDEEKVNSINNLISFISSLSIEEFANLSIRWGRNLNIKRNGKNIFLLEKEFFTSQLEDIVGKVETKISNGELEEFEDFFELLELMKNANVALGEFNPDILLEDILNVTELRKLSENENFHSLRILINRMKDRVLDRSADTFLKQISKLNSVDLTSQKEEVRQWMRVLEIRSLIPEIGADINRIQEALLLNKSDHNAELSPILELNELIALSTEEVRKVFFQISYDVMSNYYDSFSEVIFRRLPEPNNAFEALLSRKSDVKQFLFQFLKLVELSELKSQDVMGAFEYWFDGELNEFNFKVKLDKLTKSISFLQPGKNPFFDFNSYSNDSLHMFRASLIEIFGSSKEATLFFEEVLVEAKSGANGVGLAKSKLSSLLEKHSLLIQKFSNLRKKLLHDELGVGVENELNRLYINLKKSKLVFSQYMKSERPSIFSFQDDGNSQALGFIFKDLDYEMGELRRSIVTDLEGELSKEFPEFSSSKIHFLLMNKMDQLQSEVLYKLARLLVTPDTKNSVFDIRSIADLKKRVLSSSNEWNRLILSNFSHLESKSLQKLIRLSSNKISSQSKIAIFDNFENALTLGIQQIDIAVSYLSNSPQLKVENKAYELFIRLLIENYFRYLPVKYKVKMIEDYINLELDADPQDKLSIIVKHSGPILKKLLQSLARNKFMGKGFKQFARITESELDPVPFSSIDKVLRAAIPEIYPSRFKHFQRRGISGSMAQTHRAIFVTEKGEELEVAVRVLLPDSVDRLNSDLKILKKITPIIESRSELRGTMFENFSAIRDDMFEQIYEETELERSNRNQIEGKKFLETSFNIKTTHSKRKVKLIVPSIYESWTGKRGVQIMDWVSNTQGLSSFFRNLPEEFHDFSETVFSFFLKKALFDSNGFFHADIHQGNFVAKLNGSVIEAYLLDWGMAGEIWFDLRKSLFMLSSSIDQQDIDQSIYWTLKLLELNSTTKVTLQLETLYHSAKARADRLQEKFSLSHYLNDLGSTGLRSPYALQKFNRFLVMGELLLHESNSNKEGVDLLKSVAKKTLLSETPSRVFSILPFLEPVEFGIPFTNSEIAKMAFRPVAVACRDIFRWK